MPYYEEVVEVAGEIPEFAELSERPSELDAKSYMIDRVHVLISYKVEEGIPVVYDVVLHSNDLSLARELSAVSTLLTLSLRARVPYGVLLKELRSINDEFYNKLADTIQTFLSEFGVMEPPKETPAKQETILTFTLGLGESEEKKEVEEDKLAVCPVCGKRTLVVENGCYTCINPECGWSKCEL